MASSKEAEGPLVRTPHLRKLVAARDPLRRTVPPHPWQSLLPDQYRRAEVLDFRATFLAVGLRDLRYRDALLHHRHPGVHDSLRPAVVRMDLSANAPDGNGVSKNRV